MHVWIFSSAPLRDHTQAGTSSHKAKEGKTIHSWLSFLLHDLYFIEAFA
jgi:hypothetical protein